MEGITNPNEIRDLIMERVRRSRGTGIGELPSEERTGAAMWNAAHIGALREIREAVEAIEHRRPAQGE
jgi:hypothetical protein